MQHASDFVSTADSDDDDYVALDEQDMETGIQEVTSISSHAPVPGLAPLSQLSEPSAPAALLTSTPLVLAPPPAPVPLLGAPIPLSTPNINNTNSSTSSFSYSSSSANNSGGLVFERPLIQFSPTNPGLRNAPLPNQSPFMLNNPPLPTLQNTQGGFQPLAYSAMLLQNDTNMNTNTNMDISINNNVPSVSYGEERRSSYGPQSEANRNVIPFGHESTFQYRSRSPVNDISTGQSSLRSALHEIDTKKRNKTTQAVRVQKVNTNVVALDLGTLGSEANTVATGDPYFCINNKCKNILSSIDDELLNKDKDMKVDNDEKIWLCQLCGQRNIIEIQEEEKPTGESVDYILEPPSDEKSKEEHNIIFCIDTSGSMCVTQEMEGKIKLRGVQDMSDINAFNEDRSDQFLPNQKRNTTWISRLQSVQAAVDDQLTQLSEEKPQCKVALVTFSNEVTIVGDGVNEPEFIAGDKLGDMERLKNIGNKYKLETGIGKSSKSLSDKLWGLAEKGQTALGPALIISIALAAQKSGSQVILCTDGLANIGLGHLDGLETDEELDAVEQWYEQIANWALEKGVVVNVISITDGECKLENLGKVCEITRGSVKRINPKDLTTNFKNILEKKEVIATKVQATMLLHPVLRFKADDEEENRLVIEAEKQKAKEKEKALKEVEQKRLPVVDESAEIESTKLTNEKEKQKEGVEGEKGEEGENKGENKEENKGEKKIEAEEEKKEENKLSDVEISRRIQDVGNVFTDSKIYFEYVLRKELLKEKFKDLQYVIFQVQIHYVRPDGAKMLRVITQKKLITRNKEQKLKNLNMDLLAAHASRKAAKLCEEGDYEAARANIYSNAIWMNRNTQNESQAMSTASYINRNLKLDRMMKDQQVTEKESRTQYESKAKQKKYRSRQRADDFSEDMYANLD